MAAPPSSIGKFGGDTDNWIWPRHTGDFSLFRIYAGKDNKPAAYMQDAQDMDSDDPAVLSAEYHIDTHTDLDKLVDYMYLHYDVFMLLLTGAQGSEYENTVDMIVDMTEQGFRISAEKAAAKMPNCHVDEYMLHWITHISVDAYTHLLTHERDVEKAKLHMRRVMEFLIKIWFTMIVED